MKSFLSVATASSWSWTEGVAFVVFVSARQDEGGEDQQTLSTECSIAARGMAILNIDIK